MTILNTVANGFFRCFECEYTVQVENAPTPFVIKCSRCDYQLQNIGDKSKIDLNKYDEGLSYWLSCGCPDCYCEETFIDCSTEDQVCCSCLRPDCLNYDVFVHEDAM